MGIGTRWWRHDLIEAFRVLMLSFVPEIARCSHLTNVLSLMWATWSKFAQWSNRIISYIGNLSSHLLILLTLIYFMVLIFDHSFGFELGKFGCIIIILATCRSKSLFIFRIFHSLIIIIGTIIIVTSNLSRSIPFLLLSIWVFLIQDFECTWFACSRLNLTRGTLLLGLCRFIQYLTSSELVFVFNLTLA